MADEITRMRTYTAADIEANIDEVIAARGELTSLSERLKNCDNTEIIKLLQDLDERVTALEGGE